jgi:hypothetical protein
VGVFLPIAIMGLAIREHIKQHATGRARTWGMAGATFSALLAVFIFVGQIATKWAEGGWIVLIVFAILIGAAHILLISPAGYRDPADIHRIIREKSRVQGPMGNIVEWQSLRMQEYRHALRVAVVRFFATLGVMKPMSFDDQPAPASAGEFDTALHHEGPQTFLDQYLSQQPPREPRLGGAPKETEPEEHEE